MKNIYIYYGLLLDLKPKNELVKPFILLNLNFVFSLLKDIKLSIKNITSFTKNGKQTFNALKKPKFFL